MRIRYLHLHLQGYRKENGYIFVFFEGDLRKFLEEYMPSNSSCFVLSECHSKGVDTCDTCKA